MPDVPWGRPTRQEMGGRTEREIVAKRGGRVHPRSGAGSIKDDGSSDTEQIEVKDANKTYVVNGKELDGLLKRAISKNKDAVFVVYFTGNDLTMTAHITRGKG